MIKPFFALSIACLLTAMPLGAQTNALNPNTPLQVGFAVITPASGNGTGLSASETIGNLQSSGFQTAVVSAAPLTTSANVVVNLSTGANPVTGKLISATLASNDPSIIAGNHPGYNPAIGGAKTGNSPLQQLDLNPPSQSNISPIPLSTPSSSLTPQIVTGGSANEAVLFSNTAVAIVNPNQTSAVITVTLNVSQGMLTLPDLTIGPMQQLSDFVTQLLGNSSTLSLPATGVLTFNSNVPIAIAALQFRGSSFATLPVTATSPVSAANGALVLPQFVMGGGWATELLIANVSTVGQSVRVDFFSSNGTGFQPTLSNVLIPQGNVTVLGPQTVDGQTIF